MIGFISTSVTHTLLITLKYRQYSAIADLHTFKLTVAYALGFPVFTSRLLATDLNTQTVKVSLNYTLPIPLHYSTHKVFKSQVNSSSNTNFPWLSPTENSELCHSHSLSLLVPIRSLAYFRRYFSLPAQEF
jgi:hypothetical protein